MIEDGTNPTEEIVKEMSKKLYAEFFVAKERSGRFVRPDNPNYWLDIDLIPDRNAAVGTFMPSGPPVGFEFPAVVLKANIEYAEGSEDEVSNTPYGILPKFCIGNDGKIYEFINRYLINAAGDCLRFEEITELKSDGETTDEALEDWGLSGNLIRLNFIPHAEDERFVPFRVGDYEKIGSLAYQITEEELIPAIV